MVAKKTSAKKVVNKIDTSKDPAVLNMKELSKRKQGIIGGHWLCGGCAEPIIIRSVINSTKSKVVVMNATGCLEVSSTTFPFTSWNVPWLHNAFENAAATASGVETAYRVLKKKGVVKEEIKFLVTGGDGGTYDIGLQSLSGAMERGHDFLYVCLDNEAYMNTGIQRSSATPFGAWTNTCQVGKAHVGKEQPKKNIVDIAVAHNIPFVAQASPSNLPDLIKKANKGFNVKGPSFINVISPCTAGWKYPSEMTIKIAKLAVETCIWPLYEIENGVWKLNFNPGKNKKPVEDYLKLQGRFKHLFTNENKHIIKIIQDMVDENWAKLKKRCGVEE